MTLPIASVRKDLRFQCRGKSCNRCCIGGPNGGAVHLQKEDRKRLGKDLERANLVAFGDEFAMLIPAGEPCVFWAEGEGCTVYDRAPTQCRTYPWWGAIMRSERYFEFEKKRCPGLGEGPKVPLRKVRKILALDRHSKLFNSP